MSELRKNLSIINSLLSPITRDINKMIKNGEDVDNYIIEDVNFFIQQVTNLQRKIDDHIERLNEDSDEDSKEDNTPILAPEFHSGDEDDDSTPMSQPPMSQPPSKKVPSKKVPSKKVPSKKKLAAMKKIQLYLANNPETVSQRVARELTDKDTKKGTPKPKSTPKPKKAKATPKPKPSKSVNIKEKGLSGSTKGLTLAQKRLAEAFSKSNR